MIGNVTKGRGSRGVLNYTLGDRDMGGNSREKPPQILGGTFSGGSPREIAREFGSLRELRPRLSRHVTHCSIRKSPDDRDLTDEEWSEAGKMWAEQMGHDGYTIISHGDHIHVIASRITLDGNTVSDRHDYERTEQVMRQIEERFNLKRVPSSHLNNSERAAAHRRSPSMAEIAQAERGEVPVRQIIADAIDAALSDDETIPVQQFVHGLESCGITVRPNLASTGRLNGFSYEMNGQAVTSRQLGKGYTLKNLTAKGLNYDQDRDFAFLRSRSPSTADSDGAPGHESLGGDETRPGNPDISGARGPDSSIPGTHHGNSEQPSPPDGQDHPEPTQDQPGGRTNPTGRPGTPGAGRHQRRQALPGRAVHPRIVRGHDRAGSPDGEPDIPDDDGGSIEPTDNGKQLYKAELWSTLYNQKLPESLRSQLHFVDRNRRIIALNDGARVRDHGNRITTNKASDAAVELMVQEARAKQWKKVTITGGKAFKEKAARECARNGLPVRNKELRHIVEDERKKMGAREPQPGSPRWNLAAAAGVAAAGKGKLDATDRNMARQLDALNCDELEWQAIPPKGDNRNPSPLRSGTRKDLEKSKAWLRRLNYQGYDIYVRPSGEQEAKLGLGFIDDISLDTANQMFRDGLPVCCLIESSPGNYQGWVRVGGELTRQEIKEVNRTLAEKYSGDPGAASSRRFGRLCGFTNRKPNRVQSNGLPPYAKVESTSEGVAPKGPEFVARVRETMKQEARRQAEKTNTFPVPRPRRTPVRQTQDPITTFQNARDRAAARTDDQSALDFSGTLSLVRRGHSDSEIADAIRAARPALDDKKNGNSTQYIERTITRAREIAAEQQHQPAAPRPRR